MLNAYVTDTDLASYDIERFEMLGIFTESYEGLVSEQWTATNIQFPQHWAVLAQCFNCRVGDVDISPQVDNLQMGARLGQADDTWTT